MINGDEILLLLLQCMCWIPQLTKVNIYVIYSHL